VFDRPLLFEAGREPPVVIAPGSFRFEEERSVTPTLEDELHDDTLQLEHENMIDYGDENFQLYACDEEFEFGDYDYDTTFVGDQENSSLYRAYDVFIHKDPAPLSRTQLYVLYDFYVDLDEAPVLVPSKFAVVTILMVLKTDIATVQRWCSPCFDLFIMPFKFLAFRIYTSRLESYYCW
jgi:hypothetical protein